MRVAPAWRGRLGLDRERPAPREAPLPLPPVPPAGSAVCSGTAALRVAVLGGLTCRRCCISQLAGPQGARPKAALLGCNKGWVAGGGRSAAGQRALQRKCTVYMFSPSCRTARLHRGPARAARVLHAMLFCPASEAATALSDHNAQRKEAVRGQTMGSCGAFLPSASAVQRGRNLLQAGDSE